MSKVASKRSKKSTKTVAKVANKAKVTKKAKAVKSKHPKFAEMISNAIEKLGERGGSSKKALLKYIAANYKIDAKIANHHLKIALKNGLKSGLFKQSSGIGASGSFKLGDNKKSAKKRVSKKKPIRAVKPNISKKPKRKVTKSKNGATTKVLAKAKSKAAVSSKKQKIAKSS